MLRTTTAMTLLAGVLATPVLAQVTWTYNDIDADGNLELSDVEFERYSTELSERYDADADGYLSVDEYAPLEAELGPYFSAWDTETDALLDVNEFHAGLYDTYDADDNMFVDEQEFAAYGSVEDGETVGGLNNTVDANEVLSLTDWDYESLYTDGISVERLLDADVISATGDDVGDVENVLFGPGGDLVSVIVEAGGFWDIGDTHVNIPWDIVETAPWDADGIMIPITQEQLEDPEVYGLFDEELGYGYAEGSGLNNVTIETIVAEEQLAEVGGDGLGVVETGPRVWRAPDLIGDYARVRDGDALVNYGYVEDIIVRDGQIAAVLVTPDRGWGVTGNRAYPYYGSNYGWSSGAEYYDMPYDRTEISDVEAFDNDMLVD
ncbi:PRC-barrel domain-containing protein [Loktanella sp. DJP18]|uniref:PRC-barrel domain-containing protein n=1 Tax=Loktanella sp. DJP18 TaxID=3409788 RepID=UPI003BB672CB